MTHKKRDSSGARSAAIAIQNGEPGDTSRARCVKGPMERPIIFSAPMVRAILEDRKTQTRRIMKPQPSSFFSPSLVEWYHPSVEDKDGYVEPGPEIFGCYDRNGEDEGYKFPYGSVGDRLWVRETWAPFDDDVIPEKDRSGIGYKADYKWEGRSPHSETGTWRPSIHMPRWASRLTLEITKVRVERLQDMTWGDLYAEGIGINPDSYDGISFEAMDNKEKSFLEFQALWDSINGKGAWDKNPWVWVIEFRRVLPSLEQEGNERA